MRTLLSLIFLLVVVTASAQTIDNNSSRVRLQDVTMNDSSVHKKWFVSTYSGLSASFIGYRGGSAVMYSAPMGVQINRMLTNNVFAFGGVEIAPAYINFNQRFVQTDFTKTGFSNSFMAGNTNQFSINPKAYVGMGYTNDQHTFQISGSIGVERRGYLTDPTNVRNWANFNDYRQTMGRQ